MGSDWEGGDVNDWFQGWPTRNTYGFSRRESVGVGVPPIPSDKWNGRLNLLYVGIVLQDINIKPVIYGYVVS